MSKYTVSALLILLFTLLTFKIKGQNTDPSPGDLIEWNEFYYLDWNDFKGQPTEASIGDAGTSVFINAKPYLLGKQVNYEVTAYFNRQKSWAKDQSETLLAHEQLHFDIAELYARTVRKKIAEFGGMKRKNLPIYNTAISNILEASNEVDRQYDIETLHGAILKKQKMWEDQIKAELQALSTYKKKSRIIKGN